MTGFGTTREERVAAAYAALVEAGLPAFMVDSRIENAADAVVDALFPPNPLLDDFALLEVHRQMRQRGLT